LPPARIGAATASASVTEADAPLHLRLARGARLGGEPAGHRPHRLVALDGDAARRIDECEALAAEQRPQVPAGSSGIHLADAAAQVLRGTAREVQCLVRGPLDVGAEFLRCDHHPPEE
jgi:hypothetical protein